LSFFSQTKMSGLTTVLKYLRLQNSKRSPICKAKKDKATCRYLFCFIVFVRRFSLRSIVALWFIRYSRRVRACIACRASDVSYIIIRMGELHSWFDCCRTGPVVQAVELLHRDWPVLEDTRRPQHRYLVLALGPV